MSVLDGVGGVWGLDRDEVEARCPVDDWTFHPRYTEGRCPLCGWVPEGGDQTAELSLRAWMLRLVVLTLAVSAVVGWLTVSVYQRAA